MTDIAKELARPDKPRSGRGAATRARLLDATLTLIARRGVGRFTTREVVQEAGSSLGVLTYHFPTRRDLLAAALVQHLERRADQAAASPTSGSDADLATLTDGAIGLLSRMVHDERDVFLAGHELDLETIRDPELGARVGAEPSAHRDAIAAMLRTAGSDAPALDAEILDATFQGLGIKWLNHADDAEFDARLGLVVRRLVEKFFVARR